MKYAIHILTGKTKEVPDDYVNHSCSILVLNEDQYKKRQKERDASTDRSQRQSFLRKAVEK